MLTSFGNLKYYSNPYKLIVEVDKEIAKYYHSLIPKYLNAKIQRYEPHITVIRNENIQNKSIWGKYHNLCIQFTYEPVIQMSNTYFWLDVYCDFLEYIRLELELPPSSPLTKPPNKKDCFHITIGNNKGYYNVR